MSSTAARLIPVSAQIVGLLVLFVIVLFPAVNVRAAGAAASNEQRSRIVESSLKDLSIANDASIARHRLEPATSVDALGNPRVTLESHPLPNGQQRVEQDVQSSLHRLRRETVSAQTEDSRKARVDESLDRASRSDP